MGVDDIAMLNAKLVQSRGPLLQVAAVLAGKGDMIQPCAVLVESVTRAPRVRVQAEKLPSVECEDRVVEAPDVLVFVENGRGAQ
jgi:hypothetical protein